MDFIFSALEWTRDYVIKGLIITVLILWLAQRLSSKYINIKTSKRYLKWLLLGYTFCNLITFIVIFIIPDNPHAHTIVKYATGSYWFTLLITLGTPLFLLIKKLGRNFIYLFFLGITMNIGWLYEAFVLQTIRLHRDFLPENSDALSGEGWIILPYDSELQTFLNGLALGILLLIFGRIKRFKAT